MKGPLFRMTLRHLASRQGELPLNATTDRHTTTDPLATECRSLRYFLDDQLRYSQAVQDFQYVRQLLQTTALLGLGHWLHVATCPAMVPRRHPS